MNNAPASTTAGRDLPKNARPALCESCDLAYWYRGASAHPGCPSCGGPLAITTRLLKRIGFIELAGEDLRLAELQPGGLPAVIAAHIERANRYAARAEELEAIRDNGADGYEYDAERDIVWHLYTYDGKTSHGSGEFVDGTARTALKENAKAEKLERRLAKLAG